MRDALLAGSWLAEGHKEDHRGVGCWAGLGWERENELFALTLLLFLPVRHNSQRRFLLDNYKDSSRHGIPHLEFDATGGLKQKSGLAAERKPSLVASTSA